MMLSRTFVSIALLYGSSVFCAVSAQARTQSAPPDNYILHITQAFEKESSLGDVRDGQLGSDDIDLRVWGGYGLGGTTGIAIKRTNGIWRGWVAVVHRCWIAIPTAVNDTLTEASAAVLRARARRECRHIEDLSGEMMFDSDTLEIHEIRDTGKLEPTWQAAVKAGALQLPGEIKRDWVMQDGFTYVVEVRRGDQYRASVIEHVDHPALDGDRQVQAVYHAVLPLMRDELRSIR